MSILRSHATLMLVYALATAVFFSLLWKETREDRVKLFLTIFASLFVGGVIVGWLMYPFPSR